MLDCLLLSAKTNKNLEKKTIKTQLELLFYTEKLK